MTTRYGFDLQKWAAGKEEMRQALIQRAKVRGMISYSELVKKITEIELEPDSYALAAMLGEISIEENTAGRGMLSVIVVRNRGVTFVVDRILAALGYQHLHTSSHIQFRLYDGCYDNRTPTRRAQQVSAELLANFPLTRTVTNGSTPVTFVVNAELAYSLRIDPSTHLWHTFRQRGYPTDMVCRHPTTAGCTNSPCALASMHSFFHNQACPTSGCAVVPDLLIFRNEQKLVDTMLAADLFFLHLQKASRVAVVSSDDNMWPAIKTVLDLGMTVLHVHTLPGRTTPLIYSRGPRPSYTEMNL